MRLVMIAVLAASVFASVSQAENAAGENSKLRLQFERAALTHPGDPAIGKQIFFKDERTKCAVCHRVGKQGGIVGPDLSKIGGKFDRPHLIESLLQPSKQIVQGYETTSFVTESGKVLSGVIKRRSARMIRLLDANGQAIQLKVEDVEREQTSSVSLMPEGLATGLSSDEFTHLVAYLESLRNDGEKAGAGVRGPVRLPPGFEVSTVTTAITGAVAMETLPDGRILICEQPGRLRVVRDGSLLPTPFATLPVEMNWERGLIGVTIDPDFEENGYVYVCYVAAKPYPRHVISRLTADGDRAKPDSEKILLVGDDQRRLGGNVPAGHQGGGIHFGPDGCLYVGIGEQTAKFPAQKLNTFQGKMLRIRPDGSIPEDNPLRERTTGKYQAIWAFGLRNPFTFAFNDNNGELLINDVGGRYEEINRGSPGANYGWPTVEHGPTSDPRFIGPIHIYPQSSIGGSVFVPEDASWPEPYRGKYLFADFVQGWIHMIDPAVADPIAANDADAFASGLRRPVDLRLTDDEILYVLLRNAWVADGKFEPHTGSLLRIEYTGK